MSCKLSLVLPFFNEERNLFNALVDIANTIKTLNLNSEFILINDGSNDNSIIEAEKFKDLYPEFKIKIYSNIQNIGLGGSIKKGISYSNGEYLVALATDGEANPSEVLYALNFNRDFDFISFYVVNKNKREKIRVILSNIYVSIVSFIFNIHLSYYNGPFIIKTSIAKELYIYSNNFFITSEINIRVLRMNIRYAHLPTILNGRSSGKSNSLSLISLIDIIWCLIVVFIDVNFNIYRKKFK